MGHTQSALQLLTHAQQLRRSTLLSHSDFLKTIEVLNEICDGLKDHRGRKIIFCVKRGTDESILWKALVRIQCFTVNSHTGLVQSVHLLNLRQFVKIFEQISLHINAQKHTSEGSDVSHLDESESQPSSSHTNMPTPVKKKRRSAEEGEDGGDGEHFTDASDQHPNTSEGSVASASGVHEGDADLVTPTNNTCEDAGAITSIENTSHPSMLNSSIDDDDNTNSSHNNDGQSSLTNAPNLSFQDQFKNKHSENGMNQDVMINNDAEENQDASPKGKNQDAGPKDENQDAGPKEGSEGGGMECGGATEKELNGEQVSAEGEECIICMDARPQIILSCSHAYCEACIELWQKKHKECPVCRSVVKGRDEGWVLGEAPEVADVEAYGMDYIMSLVEQSPLDEDDDDDITRYFGTGDEDDEDDDEED